MRTDDYIANPGVIEANMRRLKEVCEGKMPLPYINMSLGIPTGDHVTYSGFLTPTRLIYFVNIDEPDATIYCYAEGTPFGDILAELAVF